jgi:hypothetical protein
VIQVSFKCFPGIIGACLEGVWRPFGWQLNASNPLISPNAEYHSNMTRACAGAFDCSCGPTLIDGHGMSVPLSPFHISAHDNAVHASSCSKIFDVMKEPARAKTPSVSAATLTPCCFQIDHPVPRVKTTNTTIQRIRAATVLFKPSTTRTPQPMGRSRASSAMLRWSFFGRRGSHRAFLCPSGDFM